MKFRGRRNMSRFKLAIRSLILKPFGVNGVCVEYGKLRLSDWLKTFPVKRMTCCLAIATTLSACANSISLDSKVVDNQPFGVDADPDSLLRTVAALAREGVSAMCDKAYLEKVLNIKIGVPRGDTSEEFRGGISEVEPVSTGTKFTEAHYKTSSHGSRKNCILHIGFNKNLVCDAGSKRLQSILGERTQFTSPFPGRTTRGIFYDFRPTSGYSAGVDLGYTDGMCTNEFSIAADGLYAGEAE